MSILTCNGFGVLHARITMPRAGAWTAELSVDAQTSPSGRVEIVSHGDAMHLVGTVVRGGVGAGTPRIWIVGGAGGLEQEVSSRSYRLLPRRVPVLDVLTVAGESLDATSDSAALSTIVPSWTVEQTSASRALTAVTEAAGLSWRMQPSGNVWIGQDSWPGAPAFSYALLESEPEHDRIVIGVEEPGFLPGTTFEGRRVSLVVHTIDDNGVRSEIWFERDTEPPRLLGALQRIVRRVLWRVDYLALYPARVVAQNEDGSLELKPDSDRLAGLSRIPLRAGMPGVAIKVAAGARVLLGFEEGDPSRPVALQWEGSGLTEMQIGGARPVARQGDQVTLTMPPVLPIAGTSATLGAFVGTIQIPTPLIGTILTGSGVLKA